MGFSRIVAVKRMHPHVARDPEFVAMFLDEARIAARIRHSNVIQTVDVVAEAGELFLVMEYVEGESLSRLLRKSHATFGAPPPWRVASSIVAGVLHGLQAAHDATDEAGHPLEVVHRDVSPQNILIGVDGIARLLDFGVAKAVGRMQVTREGQLKGKLPYMAPEQIRNPAAISPRTDVYGASVVAWETLTGSRLFTGDEGEVLGRVLEATVPLPSAVEPSVPRELDDVVMRGLARNPRERYQTARDMALAIEQFGVAPASEVASWVASLAGTSLADRAKLVVAAESAPRSVESVAGEERTVTLLRTPSATAMATDGASPPESTQGGDRGRDRRSPSLRDRPRAQPNPLGKTRLRRTGHRFSANRIGHLRRSPDAKSHGRAASLDHSGAGLPGTASDTTRPS